MKAGWLGIPWLSWFAIAVNFASAFINGFILGHYKRRMRKWEAARDKADTGLKAIEESYVKLASFAIMLAHAPDGALPGNLRELAQSLVPPDVTYDIKYDISYDAPFDGHVH